MFVCLSVCPHKHKTSVFRTCSKTTEAIDLKFTHNILVDLKNVLGKFEKKFCLFICLFVLKKTHKNPIFQFSPKRLGAIDSKFPHNIRVGPRSGLGNLLVLISCRFVSLFVRKNPKISYFFSTWSKTIEPIELKFINNIRVGLWSVLGNIFFSDLDCLSLSVCP